MQFIIMPAGVRCAAITSAPAHHHRKGFLPLLAIVPRINLFPFYFSHVVQIIMVRCAKPLTPAHARTSAARTLATLGVSSYYIS